MTDLLPNGLTREAVSARPDVFAGMVVYLPPFGCLEEPRWNALRQIDIDGYDDFELWPEGFLLPGEKGCPWPAPPEFRREWVEGDRAWVLDGDRWRSVHVGSAEGGMLAFFVEHPPVPPLVPYAMFEFVDYAQDTPALWVPGVQQ